MKKKFLLVSLMLVVFICLFAVSISGETVISQNNVDAEGNVVAKTEGEYSYDGQTQHFSSVEITYKAESGETKNGKIYYLTNFWGSRRQLHSTYLPSDFDMSQTVYMIDCVDANGDGVVSESEKIKGTQGDKNLYNKYGTYSDGAFTDLVNVKKQITKLNYSRYLEYFGPNAYAQVPLVTVTYNGKDAVEGTFFVVPSVNEFHGGAFGGSADGNINGDTGMFTRLVFESREHNVYFGQYCFCRNVIEEVVFLGTGTYNLRGDGIAYLWYDGTNTPCLKRVVVQDGVKFSGEISLNVGTYDIVFIGEEENYSYGNYSSCLKNATGSVIYEKICYVYGHTENENDNNCTTDLTCADCNEVLEKANESHKIKTTIEYLNGFIKNGEKHEKCTNEGCVYDLVTETNPLIYFAGISTNNDDTAICVKYAVDKSAITEYRNTGKAFNYGVVASAPQENNLEVINPDLSNATDCNTVVANIDDSYSAFDFVLRGFTDATYEKSLVMCAYITDGVTVDYINVSLVNGEKVKVSQDATAQTITMKSIVEYIPPIAEN